MSDDDLRERFEALRSRDREGAPTFEAVASRAQRPTWTRMLVPALALAGAVGLALLLLTPAPAPAPLPRVGLRDPEPLAFLLAPVPALEETP